MSGRAVQTNGNGSKGNTAHLNLTRSLAKVWGIQPKRVMTGTGLYLAKDMVHLTLVRADAWTGEEAEALAIAAKMGMQVAS